MTLKINPIRLKTRFFGYSYYLGNTSAELQECATAPIELNPFFQQLLDLRTCNHLFREYADHPLVEFPPTCAT